MGPKRRCALQALGPDDRFEARCGAPVTQAGGPDGWR
jgi:hypothetical protein